MEIRLGLTKADGTTVRPMWDELTVEQQAFAWSSVWVGMPRLEEGTLAEFTRRATLYQENVCYHVFDGGGPVVLGEADWRMAIGEYALVWSNASRLTPAQFDRKIRKEMEQ